MRRRATFLLVVPALAAGLLLSGCGSDGADEKDSSNKSASIDEIDIEGKMGTKPKLKDFEGPVKFAETDSKVLDKGDGATIKEGQQVEVDYIGFNGRTGKSFDDSWSRKQTATFQLKVPGMIQGFVDGLVGQKVGSRVLIGMPSKDAYPDGNEQAGIKKGDSLVFVVEPKKAWTPLTKATGETVKPPADLPAVEVDKEDAVTGLEKPAGDPPKELVAQPLIKGEGEKISAKNTVQLHVYAANWRTGKSFDSTWEAGQPMSVPLGQLGSQVKGLGTGLEGQTVGSRMLLVLPPKEGLGQDLPQTDVKKDDTTVWVVDILDAY